VSGPLTQRQHRVLATIERFITDEGYTPSVREVGSIVGLAPATVQQHLDALERKGYIRRTGQSHGIEMLTKDANVVHVPIVGEIAAGAPIDAYEEQQETIAVAAGVAPSRNAYALRVRGDSMIDDHICDGDVVIVKPTDTVHDGAIAVAMLEDGTTTLKRLFRDNGQVRLQPANSDYEPIYADDVRVRGHAVAILRSL
jgi:repressor LexA